MLTTPTDITDQDKKNACARAAHEMNRVWCLLNGDNSQAHWEEATPEQRLSALRGVDGVLAGNTPEQSHESWLAEKVANGWTYGPIKDPAKKTHPCMVPYDQLSPVNRKKDTIFVSTVKSFWNACRA